MNLFFGKISQGMGAQHDKDFYAAGDKGSSWYNGLEIGDYVLPIFKGQVSKLWKVKGYGETPVTGKQFERKAVLFETVKTFERAFKLGIDFCCYQFFDLDLNMLNKCAKSTSTEQKGFYKISVTDGFPGPSAIDLSDKRKLIIAFQDTSFEYANNDIRITIDDEFKIVDIEIFKFNKFINYQTLWTLYDEKNPEKLTLKELYKYSIQDSAPKKEKYLNAVMSDLKDNGYFIVSKPISLYDNILVGRKKNKRKEAKTDTVKDDKEDVDETRDLQKFEKYLPYVDLLNFNPNIILYGVPGTGKTYTAQRIIEANEYKRTGDPSVNFESINNEGRVEFVTFHQSYSYEEFVEGIRPVIRLDEEDDGKIDGIQYEIKPGILRNIANAASLNVLKDSNESSPLKDLRKESRVYKISLGARYSEEQVYNQCKKDHCIAIGWLDEEDLSHKDHDYILNRLASHKSKGDPAPSNDAHSTNIFVNQMQKGDIVFIYDGPFTIRDIGIIEGEYEYDKNRDRYRHVRKVRWIKEFGNNPLDISSYNANKRLTMKTVYPLARITFDDILSILKIDFDKRDEKRTVKPFYIVIDEINRGNISKIFGELITLIEKDKRETLKLTLPYSQKTFSLPSNLYFIGTMNTADRSIAILDTALRRRFTFKELEPDSDIIVEAGDNPIIDGKIDLSLLLNSLNKKIEKIYDRDHRIGHAYFLNATNLSSFKHVWYYQIIPLLQEYFYNDAEKVSSITGTAFIDKDSCAVNDGLSNEDFVNAVTKIYRDE